jgi:Fur family transcriptional regulator, ferric uptake regulator
MRKPTSARDPVGDLHGVVEGRLRRIDQRYTSGRRAIINLLVSAGHPVSIGDIADRLPGLPRSSAYRHLTDLETAGLVRRVAANDEFTRFELAEDLTGHHHHLVCVSCGKVTDIALAPAIEDDITHAIGQLADVERFEPQGHRLDVLGLCSSCH